MAKKNKDPLAHAEILAIKKAAKKLNTINLSNYKIYSTLEPCLFCSLAISKYFLNIIYFGAYDQKNGSIANGTQIFGKSFSGYKPEVIGGIGEEESSKMLKNFFKKIRNKT